MSTYDLIVVERPSCVSFDDTTADGLGISTLITPRDDAFPLLAQLSPYVASNAASIPLCAPKMYACLVANRWAMRKGHRQCSACAKSHNADSEARDSPYLQQHGTSNRKVVQDW